MQGIANLGLVVLGNNFPVAPIDLDDFEVILGPLELELRVPVAIQAKSGTFQLQIIEDRVGMDWNEPIPADARERMTRAMELFANEYAGRKAPTAMGQNFRGVLDSTKPSQEFLRSFLNTDRVDRVLMSDTPAGSSLTLFFKRGRESRAQLVLAASNDDEMKIAYAFNFHFDLTSPGSPSLMESLSDWEKSERFAEESVDALVGLTREGEG